VSAYLQNHPLPPYRLFDVAFTVTVALVVFAVTTYIAIARIDRQAWPATGRSRGHWLVIAGIGVLVPPAGAVTSIVWRAKIQPKLLAHSNPPAVVRDPYRLFGAASTFTGRSVRVIGYSIAMFSIVTALRDVTVWSVGDPGHVYIDALGHDIQPRPYITGACHGTVLKTLHLEDPNVQLNHHSYQRWTVTPTAGHLDRVLLDTDTGTVICP
jgi:hypothetical protein